jgi:hypothetical protein
VQTLLFSLIGLFGFLSYFFGVREMLQDKYAPSIFSRVVWLLIAINSFAGVVVSGSSTASILLAGIFLAGCAAMALVSFWKGEGSIGVVEYICLALLALSAVIWVLFSAPLVNLVISIIAHFIGGVPTYKKIWVNPAGESRLFWLMFCLADILSVMASQGSDFKHILLPVYFALFDGSLFLLTFRHPRHS